MTKRTTTPALVRGDDWQAEQLDNGLWRWTSHGHVGYAFVGTVQPSIDGAGLWPAITVMYAWPICGPSSPRWTTLDATGSGGEYGQPAESLSQAVHRATLRAQAGHDVIDCAGTDAR